MNRYSTPGEYTLNTSDYKIDKESGKFMIRELCKVCRAENVLTEENRGSPFSR